MRAAKAVIERYAGQKISLADASIVVLAERHATRDVLTLDERHFRVLRAHGQLMRLFLVDYGT